MKPFRVSLSLPNFPRHTEMQQSELSSRNLLEERTICLSQKNPHSINREYEMTALFQSMQSKCLPGFYTLLVKKTNFHLRFCKLSAYIQYIRKLTMASLLLPGLLRTNWLSTWAGSFLAATLFLQGLTIKFWMANCNHQSSLSTTKHIKCKQVAWRNHSA